MTVGFAYEAVDGAGHRVQGLEAAPNPAAARANLEVRGLVVLGLIETQAAEYRVARGGPTSVKADVLEVTRALAALLPAGWSLSRALASAQEVARGHVAAVLREVQLRVERGERLAEALAEHPAVISPLYIGLVRAGERSGNLAGAFQHGRSRRPSCNTIRVPTPTL